MLIDGKEDRREQHQHHYHGRRADAKGLFEQKEKRNAKQRAAAEADELSLREIEQHLAFYFSQIFWDIDVGHFVSTFLKMIDIVCDIIYNEYEVVRGVTV